MWATVIFLNRFLGPVDDSDTTDSTVTKSQRPHQADHTHRHQPAVFRGGVSCPEAGSKRALPSNKSGALPPETGLPVNNVRVRGQTGPSTQHKRDGVPPRKEMKTVAMGHTGTLEAEDRPGRKSRITKDTEKTSGGGQPYLRATRRGP